MGSSAIFVIFAAVAVSSAAAFLPGRPVGGPKIVGGHDSKKGDFPFQISLQWSLLGLLRQHVCGGSVLNENWILTAGHCVTETPKIGKYYVVAGEYDLSVKEGTEQSIRVGVNFNDIALLKLSSPLTLTATVQPIALPKANEIPSGQVTLSGWGSTNGNDATGLNPKLPTVLQTVDLPIVDYETCLAAWGSDSPLRDTNVCTGPMEGGQSPCQGDSGGPLIAVGADGSRTLVGVVSWGSVPCGSKGAPSVYTRVSAFLDFIQDTMANN
ncbi:hypothetical protein J437_LFUL003932 [Ladona fulva]|uniref:Peptidase S1 domain-containing protein n=1 Tax=Ladona fulva TaxID=123851 RepID=A0A8K0P4V0_LADFU|nr:hypothetical protein J437_LFUL003932 [Ladona fulva]